METLMLTRGYMPHRIVAWQKAIAMSFTGRVEVVETYDEVIRSVRLAVNKPAVVRLTRAVRHCEPRVRFSRANVLLRDDHTCQYCGERRLGRDLTFDHVVPRAQGGVTSWTNIVTACRACNSEKGSRTPKQAGLTLLSEPVRPSSLPFKFKQLRVGRLVPDPWKSWVWWNDLA